MLAAGNWNVVPPRNSMPQLNPRTAKLSTQISKSAPEIAYQRLRLPMKS